MGWLGESERFAEYINEYPDISKQFMFVGLTDIILEIMNWVLFSDYHNYQDSMSISKREIKIFKGLLIY